MTKEEIANRIVTDPTVMVGKPIIQGTRLTVELILGLLSQGQTVAEIQRNYPNLAKEDILACLAYATDLIESEQVYKL